MITGELKSKIDSLREIFWTGGLTNPLDVRWRNAATSTPGATCMTA